MARAIGVRRAKRRVQPDEQRREKTPGLPFHVRRPNRLMATVITQYEDDGVAEQTVSLQACEEAFKLEVEVAKRRDVAVSVLLESLHLRMPQWNGERMVHTRSQRGEKNRSPWLCSVSIRVRMNSKSAPSVRPTPSRSALVGKSLSPYNRSRPFLAMNGRIPGMSLSKLMTISVLNPPFCRRKGKHK